MELSERLEKVLREVESASCLIDVGCDHGFLSIEAVRRGIALQAICSDVRKGPLERAKEHIEKAGLSEKIMTRLTDGLCGFVRGDGDFIVIAGMGGLLVTHILQEAAGDEQNVLYSAKKVIIQPQSEWETVRRNVDAIGWIPTEEQFFYDKGKPYWIMTLSRRDSLTEDELARCSYEKPSHFLYGRLLPEAKDAALLDYLNRQLSLKVQLREAMQGNPSLSAARRKDDLTTEIDLITEVKQAWDSQ